MTTPEIVGWVIEHFEGFKYTDDPIDTGGATKFGITRRTLAFVRGRPVTKAEVAALTLPEAVEIGVQVFAVEPRIDEIRDWRLRLVVYDYGFHSGQSRAITALQEALGFDPAEVDGRLGLITLGAANQLDDLRVPMRVLTSREEFMQSIMETRHTQRRFMLGWWKRTTKLQRVIVDAD